MLWQQCEPLKPLCFPVRLLFILQYPFFNHIVRSKIFDPVKTSTASFIVLILHIHANQDQSGSPLVWRKLRMSDCTVHTNKFFSDLFSISFTSGISKEHFVITTVTVLIRVASKISTEIKMFSNKKCIKNWDTLSHLQSWSAERDASIASNMSSCLLGGTCGAGRADICQCIGAKGREYSLRQSDLLFLFRKDTVLSSLV